MTIKEQLIREIEKTPDDHLWQQVLDFALFLQAKNSQSQLTPDNAKNPNSNLDDFLNDLDTLEPDPHELSLAEISEVVKEVRQELWCK